MPDNQELIITRVFDAPVKLVWKAWTNPEMLKKWWAPKDFTAPHASVQLHVGGKYLLSMKGPAGSPYDMEMWSGGVYKEIIPNKKIVVLDSFTDDKGNVVSPTHYGMPESFPRESQIIITFESIKGNKTKMTIHYPSIKGIEGKMLDDMTQGWDQSLDKMRNALEESNV